MTAPRRTLAEERAYCEMNITLMDLNRAMQLALLQMDEIPSAWHKLDREVPVTPKRIKLTASFDADMVKWYRAMGNGYQARMNAVLRAYMLAAISKFVRMRKDEDWKGDPIEDRNRQPKPLDAADD